MLKKNIEKNKKSIGEIITSVFKLSQQVRYAEIFNTKSIKIAGGMKPEIESLHF